MNAIEGRLLTAVVVVVTALLGAGTAISPAMGKTGLGLAVLFCGLALVGADRMGIAALGAALATAPMYRGIGTFGPLTPTDLFLGLGLVLLLPLVLQRRWSDVPSHFVLAIGVLTVFGLLALPRAASASTSLVFQVQLLLMFAALPIFLVLWQPRLSLIDGLLKCYLAGQTLSAAKGFITGPGAGNRMLGLAHHPNDFGLAAAVCIAIVFYLYPHARSTVEHGVLTAMLLLNLVALMMSGSRGCTLAVAFVILLVPVVERSGFWAVIVGLSGAFALAALPLLIGLGGAGGAFSRLSGDATAETSDSIRENALSDGWQRFKASPIIGSGLDSQVAEYHNLLLEVGVAFGLVAVLAYSVACLTLTRPILTSHPLRRLGYIPALFLVVGLTFPGLIDRTIVLPMGFALMAAVPYVGAQTKERESSSGAELPAVA